MPYDFYLAGLIDARDAILNPAFGIRSVRQRVYRDLCIGDEALAAAIDLMNRRPGIGEACRGAPSDWGR